MLVISRKAGQQVRIGDQIIVTILKTQGKTVRVGIEAPRELHVVRTELPPLPHASSGTASDMDDRSSHEARDGKSSPRQVSGGTTDRDRRQRTAEAKACAPRSAPVHPQRWTVTTMRERVHGQSSPRAALASGASSWSDSK